MNKLTIGAILAISITIATGTVAAYHAPQYYDSSTSRLGEQQRQTDELYVLQIKIDTLINHTDKLIQQNDELIKLQKQNNCYMVWKSMRAYDISNTIGKPENLVKHCGYFEEVVIP